MECVRMRQFVLALLAATGLATPALAQTDTPAANEAFTGPRVGVLAGYDSVRPGSKVDSDLDGDDQSVDGFLYGVDVGYDIALGGAVVGVEAEINDSTGRVETNSTDPNFFGFGRVSKDRDIYVGARAGILATPATLVYVKGGYTNARLNVLASNGEDEDRANFKLDGWRLGAGVEQAIGRNTYAKLEYRYSNYGDAKFEFADGATTSSFDIDTDRHQIVAGVGLRF